MAIAFSNKNHQSANGDRKLAIATDNFVQQTEAGQKRIQSFAFVIAAGVCVFFSIGLVASSLSGFRQSRQIRLESQINPNDAPLASLVRLPGIGMGRAGAIVVYRESFSRKISNSPAFRNCDDLQKVKGIGPKTIENICEWLKFEGE
jgi:competence ComEA-like helix-hairpin-helix protein